MAKSKKIDASIALLDSIRADPHSDRAQTILRQLIQGQAAIAVANAAKLIGDEDLRDLVPNLVAAFPRFMAEAVVSDPGCFAKFRIAEALYKLEIPSEAIFRQGIRHRQPEPVWGGSEDTACSLRNLCALGLAKSGYGEVMLELADLLADPEPRVRSGAIRAIAYSGRIEAIPLLRFKTHIGDPEIAVVADCFAGLLEIAPQTGLPLVASFLDQPGLAQRAIAEMAALAIGEAKPDGALPILEQFWQRTIFADLKKSALLAIAMLRSEPAIKLLKTILRERSLLDALDALEALRLYETDRNLWEMVEMIVEMRGEAKLMQALRQP
jgi:hypothetical protein